MNNLVLLDVGGEPFSLAQIRDVLRSIDGTRELREGKFIGAVMDCEYDFGGASTIIRLGDDLKTIELTGVNDASLSAALEVQRRLGRPLQIFDLAYSFDTVIEGGETLADLRERIENSD